jgi:hypothetical protein
VTTFEPGASEVLTQGLRLQAALDRVLREEPGADHHRRVRGVRAARDRRDDDAPWSSSKLVAVERDARTRRAAARRAAVPRRRAPARRGCPAGPAARWSGRSPGTSRRATRSGSFFASTAEARERLEERLLRASRARRGPAGRGPARLGSTVAEVELDACRSNVGSGSRIVPRALLLAVGLDQRDARAGAPGEAQVASVSASTGKMPQVAPYSGDMLRSSRGRRAERREAGAEELDELADDAVLRAASR